MAGAQSNCSALSRAEGSSVGEVEAVAFDGPLWVSIDYEHGLLGQSSTPTEYFVPPLQVRRNG